MGLVVGLKPLEGALTTPDEVSSEEGLVDFIFGPRLVDSC